MTSPEFYVNILNSKFLFSLRFFVMSYIIIGVVISPLWIKYDLPEFRDFYQQAISKSNQFSPEDVEILNQSKYLFPLLLSISLTMVRLWEIILNAAIMYFMLRVFAKNYSFSKVIQIALHLSVVAEILHQATHYIYKNTDLYLYDIAFWILFVALSFTLRDIKTVRIKLKN